MNVGWIWQECSLEGHRAEEFMPGHSAKVRAVAFFMDVKRVAIGCDKFVKIWDVETEKKVRECVLLFFVGCEVAGAFYIFLTFCIASGLRRR